MRAGRTRRGSWRPPWPAKSPARSAARSSTSRRSTAVRPRPRSRRGWPLPGGRSTRPRTVRWSGCPARSTSRRPRGGTRTGWSHTPLTRTSAVSGTATRSGRRRPPPGAAATSPASTTWSPRCTPDAVRPARGVPGGPHGCASLSVGATSVGAAAPATDAGHQEHAEGGQADLDRMLDPVDAGSLRDTESPGNDRTEQGGDNTDHDRQQDRHVLPTRYDQSAKGTDDGTDDDRPDDR